MHKGIVLNNVKRLTVALHILESKPSKPHDDAVTLTRQERIRIEVAIEMAMKLLEKEIEN